MKNRKRTPNNEDKLHQFPSSFAASPNKQSFLYFCNLYTNRSNVAYFHAFFFFSQLSNDNKSDFSRKDGLILT